MGMPIGGVGQVPNQMPAVGATDFKNIQEIFSQGAKVLDTELQALTKDMVGRKSDRAESTAQDPKEVKQAKPTTYMPQQAESVVAQLASAVADVKKKKKSKLDDMLAQLALMEGSLDLEQLSPEQKAQFEELFDNLARVKKRQAKMQELEAQEVALQRQIEEEQKAKAPEDKPSSAGADAAAAG
jgi:hypothetical protein